MRPTPTVAPNKTQIHAKGTFECCCGNVVSLMTVTPFWPWNGNDQNDERDFVVAIVATSAGSVLEPARQSDPQRARMVPKKGERNRCKPEFRAVQGRGQWRDHELTDGD